MRILKETVESWGGPQTGRRLALILLLASVPSTCSILDPQEEEVRVANKTESPIHVLAWEREAAYLVDPAPSFYFVSGGIAIIEPGGSRTFPPEEIEGGYERGDGVTLFIYEVHENTAVLKTVESFTPQDLEHVGYRIRIRDL